MTSSSFKISCKASDVFLAVAAYQQLAEACDYPLHLWIAEAGGLRSGTVKSSIGLGMLLWSGIGDTIRVSLSADPVGEVKAGFLTDHRLKDADIVDQLVELVEQKAAEIEAEKQATVDRALELAK
jgi:4-hydroxy-3-methylbut-2-en-1-yl diphosphate synthase IspG/GcpE